jgi:hypothetical protein
MEPAEARARMDKMKVWAVPGHEENFKFVDIPENILDIFLKKCPTCGSTNIRYSGGLWCDDCYYHTPPSEQILVENEIIRLADKIIDERLKLDIELNG